MSTPSISDRGPTAGRRSAAAARAASSCPSRCGRRWRPTCPRGTARLTFVQRGRRRAGIREGDVFEADFALRSAGASAAGGLRPHPSACTASRCRTRAGARPARPASRRSARRRRCDFCRALLTLLSLRSDSPMRHQAGHQAEERGRRRACASRGTRYVAYSTIAADDQQRQRLEHRRAQGVDAAHLELLADQRRP